MKRKASQGVKSAVAKLRPKNTSTSSAFTTAQRTEIADMIKHAVEAASTSIATASAQEVQRTIAAYLPAQIGPSQAPNPAPATNPEEAGPSSGVPQVIQEVSQSFTGKSCQNLYNRGVAFRGEQTCFEKVDEACQTDLSIFASQQTQSQTRQHSFARRSWSFMPESLDKLSPSAHVTETTEMLHRKILNRLKSPETLSMQERTSLLNTVFFSETSEIAEVIFSIPSVKHLLWTMFLEDIEQNASSLSVRSERSSLFPKKYEDLCQFSFCDTLSELLHKQSLLADVLLTVAMPTCKIGNAGHTASLVPKLSVIHSILHQARFHELSRLQRVISVLLMNENTHQKVFDQLRPLGICLDYSSTLNLTEAIGGYFNSQLIDAVKDKKNFRLVGDNVNFQTGVKYERSNAHKHMNHWFGSAAIIQPLDFHHLSSTPQGRAVNLSMEDFLPNDQDLARLKNDYSVLVTRVVKQHMKSLTFLTDIIPNEANSSLSKEELSSKNLVVPLPVEALNEQYYAEVVSILDTYEGYISEIYEKAQVSTDGVQVHIGGDQMTRERFSGAKRLRACCDDERKRFDHLHPITFELFHLAMKFLSLFFKQLFSEASHEKGSMNGEKVRIGRKSVNSNVKDNYDADKDFAVSFINAYLVEALREFFGMEDAKGTPTRHVPPTFPDKATKETWVRDTINQFLEEMVFEPQLSEEVQCAEPTEKQNIVLRVLLPTGESQLVLVPIIKSTSRVTEHKIDRTKTYAHNVLQLGLLYKQLIDVSKSPCRERLITTLKLMMLILKTDNSKSKYALEILRFLCHQQATLSLKVAHESLYGLFVNNLGRPNTHIPCDLQMEHLVRRIKSLLKAVGPNKGKQAVMKRCKALPGMDVISANFDKIVDVVVRSQSHKYKSAHEDELKMIRDLQEMDPFSLHADRHLEGFKSVNLVYQSKSDLMEVKSWIAHYQNVYDYEVGQ